MAVEKVNEIHQMHGSIFTQLSTLNTVDGADKPIYIPLFLLHFFSLFVSLISPKE